MPITQSASQSDLEHRLTGGSMPSPASPPMSTGQVTHSIPPKKRDAKLDYDYTILEVMAEPCAAWVLHFP
jgi:hypothetical protein